MMTNFSPISPSPVSAKQENYTMENGTLDSSTCLWYFETDLKLAVISTFICVACILGLIGNGTVIWLLGFCMKRNPVTIYILNLAVADFGVILSVMSVAVSLLLISNCILIFAVPFTVGILLFHVMFSISQFLLTIISIDRCVSVLFPLWYRCHRPENMSTILCAVIWIFNFLVHGICDTLDFYRVFEERHVFLDVFFVDAVICFPLITISSLILVIRFCFKAQRCQRKKLLTAILLALFFFLFLVFPLNVIYLMNNLFPSTYDDYTSLHSFSVGYLCASVNSCVNPLIYFLVGRKKRGLCRENLKLILQRVFKQEEEVYGEELQPSVQTQVSA